ncbi:MAG: toxin PIN [Betaproteobacteria bacterium RIFCSPLOWO2_12_FULL_63_13]|nr:MAG: toxin PIN [Betaproteobacteria bacterium RIFCSPLOWO2_12_FULL_63_13]
MIAVDTNILVYAHREDSDSHEGAYRQLARLAEGREAWAIPWPCIHEFFAIVTHPRIFVPPTALAAAIDQVEAWLESPTLVLLTETELHWARLREMLVAGRIVGPRVHDARIAALCAQHGVGELWSADRDFGRFPNLAVVNPLVN